MRFLSYVRLFAAGTVASLLLAGCDSNRIRLVSTNFDEQVQRTQNLRFTFNTSVVPASAVGRWDTTQYVRFTPAIAGRFQWVGPNELEFSPAAPMGASQNYEAEITAAISQADSARRSVETKSLQFHTPYLDIASSQTYWTRGTDGSVEARVRLTFNYRVTPQQVSELAQFRLQDKPVTHQLIGAATEAAEEVTLALRGLDPNGEEDVILALTVQPGLKTTESDYATGTPIQYQVVAMANKLMVSNVATQHDGTTGSVQVYTTQALLDNGSVKRLVSITPEVDYRLTMTDNGFELRGAFDVNTQYTLKIGAGLTGVLGTTLKRDYEQTLQFGQVGPAIAFVSQRGMYLGAQGARNVALQIAGLERVRVKITKVYQNNLLAFYRAGENYGYEYNSETEDYYNYTYYDTELFGDVIQEREYDLKSLPASGATRLLTVDFVDNRQQFPGIYVVEVGDPQRLWIRASKILSISDIGLIARRSANEIAVFAHSIASAAPLKGVQVQLVSTNNQNIYSAETDGDGVAWFRDLNTRAPGFRTAMLTATQPGNASDFNVLMLANNRVETSRFDISGKDLSDRPYDAFLYGDRELYRPGDTVYLNTVVRTPDWQVVKDMPVRLRVLLPSGREHVVLQGTLSAQGSFSTQFALGTAAPTGSYQLELRTGSNQLLTSRSIAVEEFLPDKIRVQATADKTVYLPEQDVVVTLQADNLYGTPAAYRNWEAEINWNRSPLAPKGFAQFDFALQFEQNLPYQTRNGQTDGSGKAAVRFTELSALQNIGRLEGRIFSTVFDESARPVHRVTRVQLLTQRVFFGIGPVAEYVAPNQELVIPIAAVDGDGKGVKAQARVQIIRNHWETVIERYGAGYRYNSVRRPQTLVDRLVDVTADKGQLRYQPSQDGSYEIRVSKPGATAYVSREFYSYGWGSTSPGFEVSTEGNVLIQADKEQYQAGETATLLFQTPFEGKLLVTVERERVLEHHTLETKGNAARLSLKLNQTHLPNVYVTATLFRPMQGADPSLPLMVAHGFQALPVEAKERRLPVEIQAVDKTTSRTTQTVTIKTEPGAEVTVAVVDEGILQIKNSKSPNPHAWFYARRALGVEPFDLYASLLPELRLGSSKTGGDGYDLSSRVNPLTNKRVKLLSYWSGTRKADGNGLVRFPVKLPQFAGSLRIMAVAYDDNRFGSDDANMIVADPVVLTTALPRFLSPSDTLLVPVTLANTTSRGGSANARITATGPVQVLGPASANTTLPANGEGRVFFRLAAAPAIGNAKVTVSVNALGGSYTEEVDLSVRPAAPLTLVNGAGTVAQGQRTTLDLRGQNFMPQTRQARLLVAQSPLVQYSRALDDLLGYPHGCLEQTVAKAFPQIYFADLAKTIGRRGTLVQTPDYNVNAAIQKLQGMQRYDGSLSFWPGNGSETNWWGSIFAAHFLYVAQREGFDVSSEVQRKLVGWIRQQSSSRVMQKYYLSDGSIREYASREIFYGLFVLALHGEGQLATMNYWKGEVNSLSWDSRYLLATTYRLMGDVATAQRLLPNANEQDANLTAPEMGGSFASPIRDRAVALYTLLNSDPQSNQIPELARRLSAAMNQRSWLTTQESAWGFLALGTYAQLLQKREPAEGRLRVAGRTIELDQLKDSTFTLTSGLAGQQPVLESTQGTLFYFWDQRGVPSGGPVPEEDRLIRVRRTYYSRTGSPLSTTTFRQNDLVVVKLTVQATEADAIPNVVVGDLLPAGLEIENPRLSELPELAWIKDNTTAEHQDFRDDRVFFYTDLPTGSRQQHFYYVVRAVSPGTFQQGPASADAMYRGDIHSQSGAGTITVLPNLPGQKGQ